MTHLADILRDDDFLVDVEATNKQQVFERAGQLFEQRHAVGRASCIASLLGREKLGSTGLGHGVAFPHARVKGLALPHAAVLRLKTPIAFDAPDDEQVDLLVFLLVPESATQRHLEILAEIAELLSDRRMREGLRSATDPLAAHRLVAGWRPAPPPAQGHAGRA